MISLAHKISPMIHTLKNHAPLSICSFWLILKHSDNFSIEIQNVPILLRSSFPLINEFPFPLAKCKSNNLCIYWLWNETHSWNLPLPTSFSVSIFPACFSPTYHWISIILLPWPPTISAHCWHCTIQNPGCFLNPISISRPKGFCTLSAQFA